MGEEKYGVQNMVKVVDVIVECGNVIPEVAKAKSLIGRIRALAALTDELIALASLKPSMLKAEWKDFSQLEKDAMNAHIKKKFDIPREDLEAWIETAIGVAIQQIELGGKMIDIAKKYPSKGD